MRNLSVARPAVKRVSKAEQIRQLAAEGHTTRVIAELVMGVADDAPYKEADRKMAYVRAVVRQRGEDGISEEQKRYLRRRYGVSYKAAVRLENKRAYQARREARP